jgi:exoribonuclease R
MNSAGKVLGSWIGKSVVNVDINLSFDETQLVVDGSHLPLTEDTSEETLLELEQNIQLLYRISQTQLETRRTRGIFLSHILWKNLLRNSS